MNWLNLETKVLHSPEYMRSKPVARATWLNVLIWCAQQENGGHISGARTWASREWQQVCGVTKAEVEAAAPLLAWDGDDLVVWNYPAAREAEVRAKREAGREKGVRSAEARSRRAGKTPGAAESGAALGQSAGRDGSPEASGRSPTQERGAAGSTGSAGQAGGAGSSEHGAFWGSGASDDGPAEQAAEHPAEQVAEHPAELQRKGKEGNGNGKEMEGGRQESSYPPREPREASEDREAPPRTPSGSASLAATSASEGTSHGAGESREAPPRAPSGSASLAATGASDGQSHGAGEDCEAPPRTPLDSAFLAADGAADSAQTFPPAKTSFFPGGKKGGRVPTPSLEDVIAYGSGCSGSAPRDCCEAWWYDHEARPRHGTGGYTDKRGVLVGDWRASLRAFAVRWRAIEERDRQRYGAGAFAALPPAPGGVQLYEDEPPRPGKPRPTLSLNPHHA